MTEKERSEIKRLMENEESEWAMREVIRVHRQAMMPLAMQTRGFYEAVMNVGFDSEETMILTLRFLNNMMRCDESGSHTGL